ncbi:antizyme inhibitor 1b isoform X1 [Salarias fasciatus]|uniref:Antizyme inhibitor 1-like n=1 Tax=Salarias fasciatus TaxID=181472 RepID=A0A672FCN8_SALFA|nr:antizyme inhibitor 1-like isoform X1 [Salarias fasciatus]XP_029975844.1 antizyme inhibitor 1-like isoform X1 [Salarias fasciatus]
MKGLADKPNYIIELLEGGVTLEDVIDGHICEQTLVEKNAFAVGDLGALMRQHACWQSVVPRLQPYYPVKCNSSPAVIEVLASLGLGFVCASKAELSLVLEHGVPPENILLLGVFKQLTLIKHAAKNNVQHLVCESEAELSKIARLHPNAKLLLQLATEAHAAETSMAFGSSLKSCRHLLEAAKELGLEVVGVTFHVPSSCQDLQQAYTRSLSDARCVFDMGVDLGFNMNILDIGGGFTGSESQLTQVESAVRPLLDAYFPQLSGVQVLAQPGSFYVASAFSLAVSVVGKTVVTPHLDSLAHGENNEDTEFLYHMNEGVYGPFSCKLLGSSITAPSVHKHALCAEEAVYPSSLWGPSLDQLDQVVERCLLPELSVGDWLLFSNMGVCGLDEFSCLSSSSQLPVYYTVSTPDWYEMQEAGVALDSAVKNFSMLQYSA